MCKASSANPTSPMGEAPDPADRRQASCHQAHRRRTTVEECRHDSQSRPATRPRPSTSLCSLHHIHRRKQHLVPWRHAQLRLPTAPTQSCSNEMQDIHQSCLDSSLVMMSCIEGWHCPRHEQLSTHLRRIVMKSFIDMQNEQHTSLPRSRNTTHHSAAYVIVVVSTALQRHTCMHGMSCAAVLAA
jgi:hypothetical protein